MKIKTIADSWCYTSTRTWNERASRPGKFESSVATNGLQEVPFVDCETKGLVLFAGYIAIKRANEKVQLPGCSASRSQSRA